MTDQPEKGSGSLEFDGSLADLHKEVWEAAEGDEVGPLTDYDLAGNVPAKKLQAMFREQAHHIQLLGTCLGEILVASGQISPGFPLNGPQLLQFGEELRDSLLGVLK